MLKYSLHTSNIQDPILKLSFFSYFQTLSRSVPETLKCWQPEVAAQLQAKVPAIVEDVPSQNKK